VTVATAAGTGRRWLPDLRRVVVVTAAASPAMGVAVAVGVSVSRRSGCLPHPIG